MTKENGNEEEKKVLKCMGELIIKPAQTTPAASPTVTVGDEIISMWVVRASKW